MPVSRAPLPRKRRVAAAPKQRVPGLFLKGTSVFEPTGRRQDGEWSKRLRIVALFLNAGEAREYMRRRRKEGVPAHTEKRERR